MTEWEAVVVLVACATGALTFLRLVADAVYVAETSLMSYERREEKLLQQRNGSVTPVRADQNNDSASPKGNPAPPA